MDIPEGSTIEITIRNIRVGTSNDCEGRQFNYRNIFTASASYSNLQDWWNSNNIEAILNSVYSASDPSNNVQVTMCPDYIAPSPTQDFNVAPTCAPDTNGGYGKGHPGS